MSNQTVYYGRLSVDIYSIGMNIPTLYDFPLRHRTHMEFIKDENNPELLARYKKVSAYGLEIEHKMRGLEKFEVLPDSLWAGFNNEYEYPQDDEYVFEIKGGCIIMREKCANIFKQFRLGESTLTPLQIYDINTGKLWSDEIFYFFNFCEKRHYLAKSQSKGILAFIPHPMSQFEDGTYAEQGGVRDGVVEVDATASNCDIDIWTDPRLVGSVFMSEPLRNALKEQNMTIGWALRSCALV